MTEKYAAVISWQNVIHHLIAGFTVAIVAVLMINLTAYLLFGPLFGWGGIDLFNIDVIFFFLGWAVFPIMVYMEEHEA